jgi:hypothetical protein
MLCLPAKGFSSVMVRSAYCGYIEYEKMLDAHHLDCNRKKAKSDNLVVVCV